MGMLQACEAADAAESLGSGRPAAADAGIGGGWKAVGPAHKQRYLRYSSSQDDAQGSSCGPILAQLCSQLFCTAAFARLLKKVGGVMFEAHLSTRDLQTTCQ